MRHHAPTSRRLLALLLAPAALAALLACGSSDDDTGVVDSRWRVQVSQGADLRGVTVDLRHGNGFTVQQVTPIGPFAGEACQANTTGGRLQLSCAVTTDVDSPFNGWELILRHEAGLDVEAEVTSMTCVAALAGGGTLPVACDID